MVRTIALVQLRAAATSSGLPFRLSKLKAPHSSSLRDERAK
ncbi:hypothetical protein OROGR_003923 [Orobanche gracilis]